MFNGKLCARKWSWPNLGSMPVVICRDEQQNQVNQARNYPLQIFGRGTRGMQE